MKKILVPTDFSSFGKLAEKTAIDIAIKSNAAVEFIHLMDIPKYLSQSATADNELPEELKSKIGAAHQYLNELVQHAEQNGLKAKSYITETSGIEVIKNHVEQHEIDLIVIGSHGASGIKEAFLGSNTQRILRSLSAPVLVIKNDLTANFKNIVFASTFKEDVHQAFAKILNFAKIFESAVHLLYINMPYNFEDSATSSQRLLEFASQYPNHQFNQHIFNAFDEESGIIKFSKTHGIDLIATTTHGKSGFMQMLSPSITESLANHSSIPVLSVNIK
jgi:nucleotide-binding universal stress UspA family protein